MKKQNIIILATVVVAITLLISGFTQKTWLRPKSRLK
jgi:hypothetical protein